MKIDTKIAVAEAKMQELDLNDTEAEDNEVQFCIVPKSTTLNPEAAKWKHEQIATIPALQTDKANGNGNGLLTLLQQLLASVHLPQAKIVI